MDIQIIQREEAERCAIIDTSDYCDVSISIESGYKWGKGQSEEDYMDFRDEVVAILETNGFNPDDESYNSCHGEKRILTAPKLYRENDGETESLYCHPMNITGLVKKDSVLGLVDALSFGETFRLRNVDMFSHYVDFSEHELKASLEMLKQDIIELIFDSAKTSRVKHFVLNPQRAIAKDLLVKLGVFESKHDIVYDFVKKQYNELLDGGVIVEIREGIPKTGQAMCRAKNKSELKAASKDGNLLASVMLSSWLDRHSIFPSYNEAIKNVLVIRDEVKEHERQADDLSI